MVQYSTSSFYLLATPLSLEGLTLFIFTHEHKEPRQKPISKPNLSSLILVSYSNFFRDDDVTTMVLVLAWIN
jgi:hypothetical protein